MKGHIWGKKCWKIKGMIEMMVQHWSSSKTCSWFQLSDVLWEGAGQIPCGRLRETGIIAFLCKGSSYSSHRAGGNHAVLLTPTPSCYRLLWVSLRSTLRIQLPCPSHLVSFLDCAGSLICSSVCLACLWSLFAFSNCSMTIYLPSCV